MQVGLCGERGGADFFLVNDLFPFSLSSSSHAFESSLLLMAAEEEESCDLSSRFPENLHAFILRFPFGKRIFSPFFPNMNSPALWDTFNLSCFKYEQAYLAIKV